MAPSRQRQTGDAIIEAFNAMDVDKILSFRHPDAMRYFFPRSVPHVPQDNDRYGGELRRIIKIFTNFKLIVHDVVEDPEARKIVYHLTTEADTVTGPYLNEYMWTFVFDESGEKVVEHREFVDSKFSMEFLPKLRAAVYAAQNKAEVDGESEEASRIKMAKTAGVVDDPPA